MSPFASGASTGTASAAERANPAASDAGPDPIAALVIVAGVLMRLLSLGQQSFWYDEIHSMRNLWDGADGGVEGTLLNAHGPLYLVMLSGWVRLFGHGEAQVRLLSALLGGLGLVLFHRLMRPLLGREAARVALLLLACSPFHLWYSQEARNYALFFDLGLLAVAAFMTDVERRSPATFLLALVATVAACLANLSGFFLFPILAVIARVRGDRAGSPVRRYLLFGALSAALLSPWIVAGARSTGRPHLRGSDSTSSVPIAKGESPPGLASIPYTLYEFSAGHSLGPTTDELKQMRFAALKPHLIYLVPAALLFALAGLRGVRHAGPRTRTTLLAWLGVPLLLVAAVSIVNLKAPNSRYSFLAFAPYLALLATGVTSIRSRLPRVLLLGSLLLVSVVSDSLYFFSPRYWKPDCRAAGELLRREAVPDDAVAVYAQDYPPSYYLGGAIPFETPPDSVFASDASVRRWLEVHAAGHRRLWIVQCQSWWVDRPDRFVAVCRRSLTADGAWHFANLPVYRFLLRADASGASR